MPYRRPGSHAKGRLPSQYKAKSISDFFGNWWVRAIGASLLSIGILAADLFGLRSLSDTYSRNLFIPILAPIYPMLGQQHVSTVIIDDAAAEELSERYPIGLSEHGRLLRRTLCEGPSVIVVAISFRYVRDGDAGVDALANLLRFRRIDGQCRQVSAREALDGRVVDTSGQIKPVTKVFLAAPSPDVGRCVPFTSKLGEGCEEARKIDSLKAVAEPVDFSITTIDNSYVLWRPTTTNGPLVASPAVRAFQAFCERAGQRLPTCSRPIEPDEAALVTHWGLYTSPLQSRLAEAASHMRPDKPCLGAAGPPDGLIATAFDIVRIGHRYASLHAIGRKDDEAIQPHPSCRYTSEVNATLLANRLPDDPLLTEALRDRVVVYGTEISGLRDDELVPLYGRVPGTHYTAMVIDNLVSFGATYKRKPALVRLLAIQISALNVLELTWTVLMIFLARWLIWHRSLPKSLQLRWLRWPEAPRVIFYTVGVLLLFGLFYFAVFIQHWPSPNVIAMLSLKLLDANTRAKLKSDKIEMKPANDHDDLDLDFQPGDEPGEPN